MHLASILEFPLGQVIEWDLGPFLACLWPASHQGPTSPDMPSILWSAEKAEWAVDWSSWLEAAGSPLTQNPFPCSAWALCCLWQDWAGPAVGLEKSVSQPWLVLFSRPPSTPTPKAHSVPTGGTCLPRTSYPRPLSVLSQDVWCGLADGGGPLGCSDHSVLWRARAVLSPYWGQGNG